MEKEIKVKVKWSTRSCDDDDGCDDQDEEDNRHHDCVDVKRFLFFSCKGIQLSWQLNQAMGFHVKQKRKRKKVRREEKRNGKEKV